MLLLDTHALLWWLDGDSNLSESVISAIENPSTPVFVSAASAWEFATKFRVGKLPGAVEIAHRFVEILRTQDFDPLPVSIEHARGAGLMPGDHRDLFDRMLIAQSQREGLDLVCNEAMFDRFGIRRV